MPELNIEVDKDNKPLGLRPREDFYTGKYIHRSSHLILFNSKNEILIQKRAATKIWFPNLYTYSVSGTVADETYEETIAREMAEEIGISVPAKKLFEFPHFDTLDKAWQCIFVGKSDEAITADAREMSEVKWVNAELLKIDIQEHPEIYTPPFIIGMKKFFEKYYPIAL